MGIDFPHVEAGRIVVGNVEGFTSSNTNVCKFYVLSHLSQVGHIMPEFADNAFLIYRGDANDITPSSMKFDLSKLQDEGFNKIYNLVVAPEQVERNFFSLPNYFNDGITPGTGVPGTENQPIKSDDTRAYNGAGYLLAFLTTWFFIWIKK